MPERPSASTHGDLPHPYSREFCEFRLCEFVLSLQVNKVTKAVKGNFIEYGLTSLSDYPAIIQLKATSRGGAFRESEIGPGLVFCDGQGSTEDARRTELALR